MARERARPTSERRAARGNSTPPAEEAGPAVAALTDDSAAVLLPTGPVQLITDAAALSLGREAMQWSYILRNRKRWADRGPLADEQNQRARTLLEALGASANDLSAIARARVAQVSTPYRTEEEGWALRVLPLEFVLTAATGLQRVGHPDGAAPTPACGRTKGPGLAGAPIGVVR